MICPICVISAGSLTYSRVWDACRLRGVVRSALCTEARQKHSNILGLKSVETTDLQAKRFAMLHPAPRIWLLLGQSKLLQVSLFRVSLVQVCTGDPHAKAQRFFGPRHPDCPKSLKPYVDPPLPARAVSTRGLGLQ